MAYEFKLYPYHTYIDTERKEDSSVFTKALLKNRSHKITTNPLIIQQLHGLQVHGAQVQFGLSHPAIFSSFPFTTTKLYTNPHNLGL